MDNQQYELTSKKFIVDAAITRIMKVTFSF
jgi:hypothetical protein